MFSRLKIFLFTPSTRYPVFLILIFGIALGSFSVIATIVSLNVTGSNEFCQTCHEMNIAISEYKASVHFANNSGIQASCADCHLTHKYPAKLFAKAAKIKDLWYHLLGSIDTPEKYESKRLEMAELEWQHFNKSNSETCRYCHSLENMKSQDNHAERAHDRAKQHNITCIICHIGVAHKLPEIPLPESARPDGQGRLVKCDGCHKDIKTTLPVSHPGIKKADLAECVSCHISNKNIEPKQTNFYQFMHVSHKKRLPCNACHEVSDGSMKLLVDNG